MRPPLSRFGACIRARRHVAGFTLIELMVTLVLIVVIMALAAPSFATFQRNSELTSTTNTMLSSLTAARSEAMKRGRNVTLAPIDGSSWDSGWIVFVDTDGSGTPDSTEAELSREDAPPSHITAVTGAAPEGFKAPDGGVYVMFNGSGYPRLVNGAFQASSLDFKHTVSGELRRIISSPAGRLRVCKPAETGCSAALL